MERAEVRDISSLIQAYSLTRATRFLMMSSGEESVRQQIKKNQRTIGPENAHLKPDLGVLSQHEMTLTLNTHTPLLTS